MPARAPALWVRRVLSASARTAARPLCAQDTCRGLCALFEPLIARYGEAAAGSPAAGGTNLAVVEGQLTWLLHIVGVIIRGRLAYAAARARAAARPAPPTLCCA